MTKTLKFLLFLLIGFSFTTSGLNRVFAQSGRIPSEIVEIVSKLDSASNNRDSNLIQKYVSPDFTNEDGLTYETLNESLQKVWTKYDNLQYQTEIESWREEDDRLVAVTVTNITGDYQINDQKFQLNSQIKSEQYFINNQLVEQNILQEKNEVTSGDKPPLVRIELPESARPGEQFNLDAILEEPIGADLVLGGAFEDKIDSALYLEPSSIELEALTAGGIFKKVTLPSEAKDHWYSIILIRNGGLRIITQRVNVEG